MLKHTIFLDKLSAKQKISLVANINRLADDEYAEIGLPRVKFSTLEEIFAKDGDGITPYTLARTWNLELIAEVTEKVIRQAAGDVNAILVPAPKINLGAEAELALAEDPLLAKQISVAFLSAVNKCNKSGVISNFFLTKKEVANMDIEPDQQALHDFVYEPFSKVAENGKAKALICSLAKNDGAYEDLNKTLIRSKSKYFSPETEMLCLCRTQDETIAALDEGCIIFRGSEIAIQNAYDEYLSILSAVEKGRDSMFRLEEAIDNKTAISDQMLNVAVERIIDFAYRINGIDPEALNPEAPITFTSNTEPLTTGAQAVAPDSLEGQSVNENAGSPVADTEQTVKADENTDNVNSDAEPAAETAENAADAEPVAENTDTTTENADQVAESVDNATADAEQVAEAVENTPEDNSTEEAPIEDILPPQQRDEDYERLIQLAIEKSAVLLKNNKALPLKRGESFAIIGDAAFTSRENESSTFAEYFANASYGNCIGMARGYGLHDDRNDDLISAAVALAKRSSKVFVFLKSREHQQASYPCTSIPANQIALVNELAACNKNVIAIVSSDTAVELDFAKVVKGIILAPIAGKLSAQALANLVFGRSMPHGKLTTSFYVSPSEFYQKIRYYKNNNRNKVGVFVGYRFYDSQDIPVSYPFGFGLRYSSVEISRVSYTPQNIRFTVTNNKNRDVEEIIEIYSGLENSKFLRPKKELKSFCTIHLRAGTSKQISMKNLDLGIYDPAIDSNIIEGGAYTIYLGTSVSDVKAETTVTLKGKKTNSDPTRLADYLQSKTNIISNTYTLEAEHTRMANYKSVKNAGLISLLVAILVGLMSFAISIPFVTIAISGVILLVAIALLVTSSNIKLRAMQKEKKRLEKTKENFKDADRAEVKKLEELFLDEFKLDAADATFSSKEIEEDYTAYDTVMLNNAMNFDVASTDLKKSMEENGVFIDRGLAASVIASFVSSRLIIAKSSTDDSIDAFVEAVTKYFDARTFTETITEAHNPANKLLHVASEDGTLEPTAVLNAIVSANENPQIMHVIHIKNLPTAKISEILIPYIKYFSTPHSKAEVYAKGSDKTYVIPENVWFITELEHGSLVENIPAYVLECASMLPVKFGECQPAEEKSEILPITLTDFEFLNERSRAKYMLTEDTWKKIDTIEAFAFKHSAYKISNKLFLQAETYIAVLLSAGTTLQEAIDSTLAAILLPPLASSLVGKIENTDKNLMDETERIFGEDNVQVSREMLTSKA